MNTLLISIAGAAIWTQILKPSISKVFARLKQLQDGRNFLQS